MAWTASSPTTCGYSTGSVGPDPIAARYPDAPVTHSGGKANGATDRSVTPQDFGGAEGARTPDPKTASLVLSQLSYSPTAK